MHSSTLIRQSDNQMAYSWQEGERSSRFDDTPFESARSMENPSLLLNFE